MKNHVYKVLELVGSSETSIEDAITTAVAQANKTVRNMDCFEVVQTRGHIENGKIGHYQVTLKIGFTLEEWISCGTTSDRGRRWNGLEVILTPHDWLRDAWKQTASEPFDFMLQLVALARISRLPGEQSLVAIRHDQWDHPPF
jgi:flavin-binding protein dodecin